MQILYTSTRGGGHAVSAAFAVLQGLCPDGGLYVPSALPDGRAMLSGMSALPYHERAARVIVPFMSGYDPGDVAMACKQAYGDAFEGPPAPLRALPEDVCVLELYHGPTQAFKDMALQLLPRLMTGAIAASGHRGEVFILVATSGDTGKAALCGFADVPGTRVAVFYPGGGVSDMQRRQMVTQEGGNVHVIAVQGNFDDAQTGVKRLFTDADFAARMKAMGKSLSSANSMNWGRLVPQIAYYFSAYADMAASGAVRAGAPVNVCVPTGNFGNILAAHYARRMGLPIARLICASNRNRVLADFMETGRYDSRRAFHLTPSPSMDILVSSNLERLLFELAGGNPGRVGALMAGLAAEGRYSLQDDELSALQAGFAGGWCADEQCLAAIADTYAQTGYVMDPHTAVGRHVLAQYRASTGDNTPALLVSTASPYKFASDVLKALAPGARPADDFAACEQLQRLTGMPMPGPLRALHTLPVRHSAQCAPEDMAAALLAAL